MTGQDDQTSTVTPLADAILQLRDRDILSMHALPWAQRRSVTGSSLEEAYDETIGRDFPNTDCVFAGGALDSFFRPEAALDLAQHCAAEAFGADYTFFISCGVALASKVALSTCCEPLSRVLLCDPGATVSPAWLPESVDVVRVPLSEPDGLPRTGDLLDLLGTAAGQGWPFTTLVMSAPGADLGYDYPRLLDECLRRSPDMTIIVDESPCGVHNFHSTLRPGTALGAAQMVSRQLGKEIRMMVVHEASQTMIAARQGAYLHVFGPIDLIESVRRSLYSFHTTSPSFPILASLDLARAHAQESGEYQVGRALAQAAALRRRFAPGPAVHCSQTSQPHTSQRDEPSWPPYLIANPLAVVIPIEDLVPARSARSGDLRSTCRIRLTPTVRGLVGTVPLGCSEEDLAAVVRELQRMGCPAAAECSSGCERDVPC